MRLSSTFLQVRFYANVNDDIVRKLSAIFPTFMSLGLLLLLQVVVTSIYFLPLFGQACSAGVL